MSICKFLNNPKSFLFFIPAMYISIAIALTGTTSVYAKKVSKVALTKEVWTLFGHDKFLSEIKTGSLDKEEGMILGDLNKEQEAKVTKIINDNFAEIEQLMIKYISENASTEDLQAMISWAKKPAGKKSLRDFAHTRLLYNDYNPSMTQAPPELSTSRTKLMHKFTGIYYEYTRRTVSSVFDYNMTVRNSTLPAEKRKTDKELESFLTRMSVTINERVKQILPHIFDRSYRKLSLEEVSVFIKFHESPAAKRYHKIFYDAMDYAIQKVKPKAVLELAKIFDDELSILSPYSKVKITKKQTRELLGILIERYGKGPMIQAIVELRNGQITIMHNGEEKEVYGRPNQDFVTVETIMLDMERGPFNLKQLYAVIKKKIRRQ